MAIYIFVGQICPGGHTPVNTLKSPNWPCNAMYVSGSMYLSERTVFSLVCYGDPFIAPDRDRQQVHYIVTNIVLGTV
jgi:hypothetical protein